MADATNNFPAKLAFGNEEAIAVFVSTEIDLAYTPGIFFSANYITSGGRQVAFLKLHF